MSNYKSKNVQNFLWPSEYLSPQLALQGTAACIFVSNYTWYIMPWLQQENCRRARLAIHTICNSFHFRCFVVSIISFTLVFRTESKLFCVPSITKGMSNAFHIHEIGWRQHCSLEIFHRQFFFLHWESCPKSFMQSGHEWLKRSSKSVINARRCIEGCTRIIYYSRRSSATRRECCQSDEYRSTFWSKEGKVGKTP